MTRPTALVFLLIAGPTAARVPFENPSVDRSSSTPLSLPVAPAAAPTVKTPAALLRARKLYFTGDVLKSAEAFETAVKTSSTDVSAWLDGAIAWAESGRPQKAVAYARKAAALSSDPWPHIALGWELLRAGQAQEADEVFSAVLTSAPDAGYAILGAGRAKLALNKPAEAVPLLQRSQDFTLQQTLADFSLGRAQEALGDTAAATEAYRRAVAADSYFHEGRNPLTRAYLRQKRYVDAWRQLSRLAEAEPSARLTRALLDKVRPLLAKPEAPPAWAVRGPVAAPDADSETAGAIPVIRVGVATTALGKPRPRLTVTVRGSGSWRIVDAKTNRLLASCAAQDTWTIRLLPPKKKKKSRAQLEMRGPDGQAPVASGDAILLKPDDPARGSLSLEDDPERGGPLAAGRAMRGAIEVSLYNKRRSLRLVNIVDLEDYTQGVVGAEMPSNSPLEALKAQALIARSHALFIKRVSKRHKKEGYDVCDEQHCQVYGGLRAETDRTRAVVLATRGRVAVSEGRIAHVIYSSNCGGFTQSSGDIGWGNVPYWKSVSDAENPQPPPASPTELRRFLASWPAVYCRPSGYVHPSHSRWTRIIPAKDLEEKLNRKFRIGRLNGLRVLRRAPTGHVESLLILGSKKNVRLKDEMDIRSLLGVGSLRSTYFVMDVEYRVETPPAPKPQKGKKPVKPEPRLVPETFVFRGGGWGHSVGLCQSGAIGRAEAGQNYETIVKAYFAGVQIQKLDY